MKSDDGLIIENMDLSRIHLAVHMLGQVALVAL